MRRASVQGACRTATHRAGSTTTGVALPPLRHASATPLLEAGVHPRLRQRSLGPPNSTTTMGSFHLTHTGPAEASERLHALRHGRLPCPPSARSARPLRQQYLERSPHLPLAHRKVLSAIQQCQSGPTATASRSAHTVGEHHRVPHACGNRHCPQCPQHTTPPWLPHPLDPPLPGPHGLLPAPSLRRSDPSSARHQRLAYQALLQAAATARKRLATDERCIGTDLPGCTGGLHTWGGHSSPTPTSTLCPAGASPRTARPGGPPAPLLCPRASPLPLSRALCKADMRHAGLLEHIAPQGWTLPWHVHSRANHPGHAACTSLAPSVCQGAIAYHRLVSLTDRTVTCTSRTVGSARLRTTPLTS